jgi:ABC-type polysaccharide/polyol phosphate export permease
MPLYVLLVGVILRSGTADYPLFVFAAVLPWKWFTSSMADATPSVSTRDQLIKQVPFPKLVLPVAAITAGIPQFAFGLIPLLGLMLLFYRDRISLFLLLIPVVAAVQLLFTYAAGILLAAFDVFARDTGRLTGHAAAVVLPVAGALLDRSDRPRHRPAPGRRPLLPIEPLHDAVRGIPRPHLPPASRILRRWHGLIASACLLAITLITFKRLEPKFAKVVMARRPTTPQSPPLVTTAARPGRDRALPTHGAPIAGVCRRPRASASPSRWNG